MIERAVPILACREVDDVLPFYVALGFEPTYRQEWPHPYLCLRRGHLEVHFTAMQGHDPQTSRSSVILLVNDTGALYDEFAAGLRASFGKVPVAGVPRVTRPHHKNGRAGGFSVVDPAGNRLRVGAA